MIETLSQDELQLRDEQNTPHQFEQEEYDQTVTNNLPQSNTEPELPQSGHLEQQIPGSLHYSRCNDGLLGRDNHVKGSPIHPLATPHTSHTPQ